MLEAGVISNDTYQLQKVNLDGIVINNTIFYAIQKNFVIALEVLFYYNIFGDDSFLAVYPQVHCSWGPHIEMQLGLGFVTSKKGFVPQFANRLIFAPRTRVHNLF